MTFACICCNRCTARTNDGALLCLDCEDLRRVFLRIPESDDGCWVWRGSISSEGYGRKGKMCTHRLAYLLFVGEIPIGLELDHLCRNRACCNPRHLEAVTRAENIRRGARGVLQTECKRGHPYPENMKRNIRGQKYCAECKRIDARVYYAKKRREHLERHLGMCGEQGWYEPPNVTLPLEDFLPLLGERAAA